MTRQTIRTLTLLVVLLALAAVSGCGDKKKTPYRYADYLPADVLQEPETERHYALVETFDAGVGELRGIDVGPGDRVTLVGSEGVRAVDASRRQVLRFDAFEGARSVAVARDGGIYVGGKQKVVHYDAEGKPLGEIGTPGFERGQLGDVTSVVVHGDDLLVADAHPRHLCIHRYSTDGTFLNEIARHGADKKELLGLVLPSSFLDMVIDASGDVILGNTGRMRVEYYGLDGGRPKREWGSGGMRPEQFTPCCNPVNLALTREGLIVTAEKDMFARVKVYDGDGKLLAYIGPKHFPGKPEGMDLAVDSKDRIYVAYPVRSTVMVFARKEPGS